MSTDTRPRLLPFCSELCRSRQGQLEDDEGRLIGWCKCRGKDRTDEPGADEALNAAAAAHPGQMQAARLILRDAAEGNQLVSANTVRSRFELSGVDGPVRAAAFRRAVADGWLEPASAETSTDPGTHGKPVIRYRSLIARDGAR